MIPVGNGEYNDCNKKAYQTYWAADSVVRERQFRKRSKRSRRRKVRHRIYKCPTCHCYHLTSSSDKFGRQIQLRE